VLRLTIETDHPEKPQSGTISTRLDSMPSDAAELSSLATTLGELERRLGQLGLAYEGTDHEDAAAALFDAERTIRAAARSVERARQALR
jgi:hypothetical protein